LSISASGLTTTQSELARPPPALAVTPELPAEVDPLNEPSGLVVTVLDGARLASDCRITRQPRSSVLVVVLPSLAVARADAWPSLLDDDEAAELLLWATLALAPANEAATTQAGIINVIFIPCFMTASLKAWGRGSPRPLPHRYLRSRSLSRRSWPGAMSDLPRSRLIPVRSSRFMPELPALELPVPSELPDEPLPAELPPVPSDDALPEPVPVPAALPPVPNVELDAPPPAELPPVPSVEALPEPVPEPAALPPVPSVELDVPLPAVLPPVPTVLLVWASVIAAVPASKAAASVPVRNFDAIQCSLFAAIAVLAMAY
jgi:hypothetical protein